MLFIAVVFGIGTCLRLSAADVSGYRGNLKTFDVNKDYYVRSAWFIKV